MLTRREFLRLSALVGAGVALGACASPEPLPRDFEIETLSDADLRLPIVPSPDGKMVLFGPQSGLFEWPNPSLLDLESDRVITLDIPGYTREFIWTPKSDVLWAYADNGWGKGMIYRVDKYSEVKAIGGESDTFHSHFALSPDGKSIAYSQKQGDNFYLTIRNEVGKFEVVFLETGVNALNPAWSPDGKFLAFIKETTDGWFKKSAVVNLYNLETGNISQLGNTEVSSELESVPIWSPDSRKLAVYNTEGKVLILNSEGETVGNLSKLEFDFKPDRHRNVKWLDNISLALEACRTYEDDDNKYYNSQLTAVKFDGSSQLILTDDLKVQNPILDWRNNDLVFVLNGYIYTMRDINPANINIPIAIAQPRALWVTSSIKWMPDGKLIFVGSAEKDYANKLRIFTSQK